MDVSSSMGSSLPRNMRWGGFIRIYKGLSKEQGREQYLRALGLRASHGWPRQLCCARQLVKDSAAVAEGLDNLWRGRGGGRPRGTVSASRSLQKAATTAGAWKGLGLSHLVGALLNYAQVAHHVVLRHAARHHAPRTFRLALTPATTPTATTAPALLLSSGAMRGGG